MSETRKLFAYIGPMFVFVAFLAINGVLKKIGHTFWHTSAEYWIYPLQTLLCGALLLWFRNYYHLGRPARLRFALGIGVLVFIIWIAPQVLLGYAPRLEGFNPDVFAAQPGLYWPTIFLRFLRLVVVVPFAEEIFWRGFLLRYLIEEKFDRVPFGTFSWVSFAVVAAAFALSHSPADWPAALLTGVLYNTVAYRTKSLSSCIITHALTNLLLGIWIMQTKQWGFW